MTNYVGVALDLIRLLVDIPYFIFLYIRAASERVSNVLSTRRRSLDGETFLVTGAASGLGRSIVIQLARRAKVTLVLWDINQAGLYKTAEECRRADGVTVYTYLVDLSKSQQIIDTAAKVRNDVGPVTVLYNNAGLADFSSFLTADLGLAEKIVSVNLVSHFWTLRQFLPDMVKMGRGRIVTTCSGMGFSIWRNLSTYVTTKHGIRAFIECLKMEMRHHPTKPDIRFTTVYPGWVRTPMSESISWKLRYKNLSIGAHFMNVDQVAAKVVDGIETEAEDIMIPWTLRLLSLFEGFLPSRFLTDVEDAVFQEMSG